MPGQYIVVYKDQWDGKITDPVAQQALHFVNARLSELGVADSAVKHRYEYALRGFAAKLTQDQIKSLQQDSRVDYIEQDRRFKAFSTSGAPSGKAGTAVMSGQTVPWGVSRVDGSVDGTGEKAWIIDSGIDLDHPDLNVDVVNSTSFIATESADDGYGHGTHVAGIVAAINNNRDVVGVAEGADVVAVKVCHNDPQLGCPTNSIVDGVDYIAINAEPDDIVNMSLGGFDPNNTITVIDDAVTAAANASIRFTIAAGNATADAQDFTPARVNHPNVWTVSAFRQGDEFAQVFDWNTPNCNPQQSPFVGSNFGNPPC